MKKYSLIFLCSIICLLLHTSGWSKQVVTESEKNWAQTTISQEKSLKTEVIPNSLAVLYFDNQTGWDKLNVLQKGLTLMLITDLAKIPQFQLVERVRLQALLDEMKFEHAEIFSKANRARLGNLLRAEHIVGGNILKDAIDQFRFDSKLVKITSDSTIAEPQAAGQLLAGIFKMEKELLFEIIDQVNIAITEEQKATLEKPLTNNLTALLYLFEGVELSDQGKHTEATEKFQKALQEDPELDLAKEFLADTTIYFAMPAAGPTTPPLPTFSQYDGPNSNPADPTDRTPKELDNDGDGSRANEDCDDQNPAIYPMAVEISDGIDNNCNGQTDEGFDSDGDGFAAFFDCDDTNPAINSSALESCDGIDNNCNGQIDEGFDNDGDGFASCNECDDTNPAVNPTAVETCNNIDDNCDGKIDEGFDNDGDGFASCADCDDANPAIHPNALETCNNIDDNCDGMIDDGLDSDGDGYAECVDCNDADPTVNPGAHELCNNIDDNCDGQIDEGFDNDGDGFLACVDDCNDFDANVYPFAMERCDQIDNNCNGIVDEGACSEYITGSHPFIVDPESINQAQQALLADPSLAAVVDNGEFRPGYMGGTEGNGYQDWEYEWYPTNGVPDNYLPGLQLLGENDGERELFINQDNIDQMNGDGFLAYVVQVEEDRLNRAILEAHRQQTQGELRASINDALYSGDIRARDDILAQQADAQSGRVLMDQAGNWVRVQQYILRPNDTTIQVLNVNLRGGGEHAGLSSMDFTTTLNDPFPLDNDLRMLPWSDWLNTRGPQLPTGQGEADIRHIDSNNDSLASMSVRFTAPSGDYLAESRTFGPSTEWCCGYGQPITSEILEFSMAGESGIYSYTTDWQNATPNEYWVFPDTEFQYTPPGNNPSPFYYMHRTGPYNQDPQLDEIAPLIMTEFFVVGDGHIAPDSSIEEPGNQGVSNDDYSWTGYTDIWDALRTNEADETAPSIGQNNLEITFKQGFSANASIDLVYIPMSRMAWNPSRTFIFP